MSLRDAIEDIVKQMEEDCDGIRTEFGIPAERIVRGYVRQFRSCLKAAGPELVQPPIVPLPDPGMEAVFHRDQIERAKAEFKSHGVDLEESEPVMRTCYGGKSDGTVVQTDSNMPLFAKMRVGDEVYQLIESNRLAFVSPK